MLVRLDPALADRLKLVADVEGRPMAEVIREALHALVERRRRSPQFRRLVEEHRARTEELLGLLDEDSAE